MRVRKLPLKQQLFIDFLAWFLAGIVLSNLIGADSFQKNGTLTRYYFKQFQYTDIRMKDLLWHVGSQRLTLFLALLVLTMIPKGKIVHMLFAAWSGFAYGYFCVVLIGAFGAKGICLCLLSMLPQFLAYVPAYMGLIQLSEHRSEHASFRNVASYLFLFIVLVVGILLESYVNPLILQKVLKIF